MQLKRFCVEPLPRISDAFYLLTAQTYHLKSYDLKDHRSPTTILFGPLGDIPGVITFFFPSDSQAQVLSFDTGLTSEDRLVEVEKHARGSGILFDGMRVTFQSRVAVAFVMVRFPDAGVRVLRWSEQDSKAHPDLRLLFVNRNRRNGRRPVTYLICLQVPSDFDPRWEITDATHPDANTLFGTLECTVKDLNGDGRSAGRPPSSRKRFVPPSRDFSGRWPEIGEEVFEGLGITFQGHGVVFPFVSSTLSFLGR